MSATYTTTNYYIVEGNAAEKAATATCSWYPGVKHLKAQRHRDGVHIYHNISQPSDGTFVEILFGNAQSPNPPQAHGYVAVLKKKAPHPRNPRSSPPFTTADSHLSPLVKLIHLSHTTARCHPIHASFIRTSRHIHRKRSDTRKRKSKSRDRDKISGKVGSQTPLFCCAVLGCCNVHLLSVKCTQRGREAYV